MNYDIENAYILKYGIQTVCGVDEAGRGPLCGPVYAAAVVLPNGLELVGVNDSKKLSEKKREELFDIITEKALFYGIGKADEIEIDELNIANATFLAMKRAIEKMGVMPDLALIDGNRIKGLNCKSECIIKGDSKSISIAAASILAKVSRDRFMAELDAKYPEYRLSKHKGYPTKEHYEIINKFGILPIYRKSFLKSLGNHQ